MRTLIPYANRHAFLRQPSKSIVDGLTQDTLHAKPNYESFKKQYDRYVQALIDMGLDVHLAAPDERFPDGNFIEDTYLVLDGLTEEGKVLIELNPGAASRKEEPVSLREFLPNDMLRIELPKEFSIDGGDILEDRKTLYVGLSKRTQVEAVNALRSIAEGFGYKTIALTVPEGLHLKSGMTCFLPGHFIIQESFKPLVEELKATDSSIQYFVVPQKESFAANVLPINGKIMIPAGCPKTKEYLEKFYPSGNILEVDTSQARLVDGALTCSSLLM